MSLGVDNCTGELATELLKILAQICRGSFICRSSAEQLKATLEEAFPIIQEIKYSGVELPQARQSQLDRISETMRDGLELCLKVTHLSRWNPYKNLQYARKMEKLDKMIARLVQVTLQAHMLADIHHLRLGVTHQAYRLNGIADTLAQASSQLT